MGIEGVMAILIFVLSLVLLVAGAASGYQSVDLLPTSIGVLYALAATVAVCGAVVTFAIAVADPADRQAYEARAAIRWTLDLSAGFGVTPLAETTPADEVVAAPLAIEVEPAGEPGRSAGSRRRREPDQFQSLGHLPSLEAIETVLETPE